MVILTAAIDRPKTGLKKAIQKTAEATDDLVGKETTDEITSVSKSSKELHLDEAKSEIPKESYISPEKKTISYWWIKINIIIR